MKPTHGRVLAYVRVSTTEQADSGLGLAAQRATIEGWARAHRVKADDLHWFTDGGVSGSTLLRPQMQALLGSLRPGDRVVVAKLDRLSRSLLDFAELLQRSQQEGWGIVALDLGLDLSTPTGRLVAGVMASVAEWERATIGARTADALAQARKRGRVPGPRSRLPRVVQDRLLAMRAAGLTFQQRADLLNVEDVPTVTGLRWTTGTVDSATRSAMLEAEIRATVEGAA